MDRRLLILGTALMIVALIVVASPVAGLQATMLKKILNGVNDLKEPKGYEYYTGRMYGMNTSSSLWVVTDITNMGDSPATVCVIEYGQISGLSAWEEFKNHTYTLNPHWSKTDTPTLVRNVSYLRFVKITTDSKFVAPQARFFDSYISSSVPAYEYLPGDFQKVEIYG